MNWGYKIALTFTVFVGIMMYMVITSFNQNIDLVTENYYQEEIQYEEQIIKLKNVQELEKIIEARFISEGIELSYPEILKERLEGSIQLYRPSSKGRDRLFDIELTDSSTQLITADNLTPGKYVLKIDYTDGIRDYFQEIPVYVPGI